MVIRQLNILSQMRLDVAHLRMIESAGAHDFDLLAGQMIAGKLPLVVSGFTLIQTGAVGNDAEALVLQTAGSSAIHFYASESGSIFSVPLDRANETLSPVNPRVDGSFTPSSTNYIGLDLVREVDDTTADTVEFLSPLTNLETPKIVPLGKILDYRLVITNSASSLSSTRGLLPLWIVTTDAVNKVTGITDARYLFGRLGAGGSSPNPLSSFGWPGGRNESDPVTASIAGDRSIFSLKEWMNATMSRIWEIGGGEFWYSNTADRNVRFGSAGTVFTGTGEPFQWDGTDLTWQVLRFVFENSNGIVNEIDEQLVASPGLTDLADGECLAVDLDRTQDRTVSGANPIVPFKSPLQTLGGSTPPGSRIVIAWRSGSSVYMRDQPYPIGGSLKLATTLSAGTVKASVDPDVGTWTPIEPVAAIIDMNPITADFCVTAGGLSHNLDDGSGHLVSAGNLIIGRGEAAGDNNVIITTDGSTRRTVVTGQTTFSGGAQDAAFNVELTEATPVPTGHVAAFGGNNGVDTAKGFVIENGGALHIRNAVARPNTPLPTSAFPARMKMFGRASKVFKTNVRLITVAPLPACTAAGSGVGKTLTGNVFGALSVDSIAVALNDRIGVISEVNPVDDGVYVVTATGSGGSYFILTRATDSDTSLEWPENSTIHATAGSINTGAYFKMDQASIIIDADDLTFTVTDGIRKDELVVLWWDGSVTTIASSPSY